MRAAAAREVQLARRGGEVQLDTEGSEAVVFATGQEETKATHVPQNVSITTTEDHVNLPSETSTELAPVDALS